MRLSSLLPMLLLLASPVSAQLNCTIFDLSASVVQFDTTTCEFFVVLDFQHAGTTNQFHVKGNGVNYGTFGYNQVPVTVGPIMANPQMPLVLNFLVQDAVFQDCAAGVALTVPGCSSHTCDITNLTVDVGNCGPNVGTYSITVDFDVTTPVNTFFELSTAGGVSLGLFPLNSLPLTLPNFPWGGGIHDVLKVCIGNNPDCCETIEFLAPDCVTPGCGINGLFVETGDCLSDSTYKAQIGFQLSNTLSLLDSFSLFLDGSLVGMFGINQLPLNTVFETTGNAQSIVEVCVALPSVPPGVNCCTKVAFDIPVCLPPCGIKDLNIETDSCTSDSTFGVWVNFMVNDSTAVDSFQLWGNGQSLGMFGMNQLPLNIPNFEWNGLIFNTVRVCTGNAPGCCKEIHFLAPDCLPFDSCEVTSIFVKTGPCTSDSTYNLTLNFNATNPGNGTFLVWANGVLLDTFNLTQVPLLIPNFPWNGGGNDIITVCIGGGNSPIPGSPNFGCCKSKEFPVPDCLGTCDITDLNIEVGDCDPNTNTYPLTINFNVVHPGNDSFDVFVNGQLYGTYLLNQLPLHIPNFPHSGNIVDVIKICINDHPNCCAVTEIKTPDCNTDCHIFDLSVTVGVCNPAGGYQVKIDFGVNNPGNDFFDLYINGQLFGIFPLNQLPLTIPTFPGSGNPVDVIKICIHDHPDCCVTKEIQAPMCNPCEILDLEVATGDCNPDSTYHLTVNFSVVNSNVTTFVLFGNGISLGTFNISQLPLTIQSFPWDGMGPNDVLKVCVGNNAGTLSCCKTIEFPIPACLPAGNCEIFNLVVDTGDCTSDSTYTLLLNFQVQNPLGNTFGVWANGMMIGTYNLSQLPLTIQNFPWGGNNQDVLKVCFVNPNGLAGCCKTIEFHVPACLLNNDPCDIFDLHVQTGNCTSDSTYQLTLNFGVTNPTATLFGVWANGQFLGMYGLGQLPLTIQDFPWDGGPKDVLKVCFATNAGGTAACCETIEFAVPGCLLNNPDCEIYDLTVDTGDCTSDSTYNLVLNFQANNPISNVFRVWANGQPFGTFNLNQLPLTLLDFPWSGGNKDVLKVCFVTPNGIIGCCKTIEFNVPDCLTNGGDCEIFGMVVDPGNCTSDSSYNLFLNFQVQNPPGNTFGVWANGVFQGTFNLNQLPLNFPNFPWDGGLKDVVKVCFVTSAGTATCCRSLEFDVPDCLGSNNDCHIWDVMAIRTGCLCGQFFVAVTFNHDNGGAGGFDLVGNGNLFGTYPYNTQQPIILGPFVGDGTTIYEFGVVDHNNGNCEDGFVLGTVECQSPVVEPGTPSSLIISPNPAANWLNITAMLENGIDVGQASVKIYAADGRLIRSEVINNAASFQMDVSNISAGVYRISILAAAGRLEGSFTKQ